MMIRKHAPSNSPYANLIGFSRAVRVDNFVVVGGTAPIGADGKTVGLNDAAAQARQCIRIIESALHEVGASLSHVVRTRILLTQIEDWEEVSKVRGEFFRAVLPVDTVMEVGRFINPEWLVEIEVDAVVNEA